MPYVLIAPHPWTAVPIYAGAAALGVLALDGIVRTLLPGSVSRLSALLPFVFLPSSVFLYGQPHRDVFVVSGFLLIFYSLSRIMTGLDRGSPALRDLARWFGALLIGALLTVWMRAHALTVLSAGIALLICASALLVLFCRHWRSWAGVRTLALLVMALLVLTPFSGETKGDGGTQEIADEQTAGDVGIAPLDRACHQVAAARRHWLGEYADGLTTIDGDVAFRNCLDLALYAPKALSNSLWAPYPSMWFQEGALDYRTVMRSLVIIDMMAIYLATLLLVWWLLRERSLVSACLFIVPIFYATVFGLVVINAGSLFRYTMPLHLLFVGLALGVFFQALQRSRGDKRVGEMRPAHLL